MPSFVSCLLSFLRRPSCPKPEPVLDKLLECPICMEVPKTHPIFQCENGHLICKSCHSKVLVCPLCRKLLGNNRSLVAERLLEVSSVSCSFTKHGCEAKLILGNLDNHVKECQFREAACPFSECLAKLPIRWLECNFNLYPYNHTDQWRSVRRPILSNYDIPTCA